MQTKLIPELDCGRSKIDPIVLAICKIELVMFGGSRESHSRVSDYNSSRFMFDLVLIQYLVKQSKRFQFINLDNLYILGKSSVLGWWRHLNLTEVQPKPILVQLNTTREKFRAVFDPPKLKKIFEVVTYYQQESLKNGSKAYP